MQLVLEPATAPTPPPPRTRREFPRDRVSTSFAVALVLHATILGAGIAWTFIANANNHRWGENSLQTGSISATMVPAIPLPPRQLFNKEQVLTSENASPAPAPPKPKAEPPPKPNEVLIPEKVKPAKVDNKPAPEPPKHPQPAPPTPKATTGDTSGVRIPMAVMQNQNGTSSITLDNKSFGDRYAYYIRIVNQKLTQNWIVQDADPRASNGRRAVVVFTINPDGTPTDAHIQTRSGSQTLDLSALRAVQRIDGFGTLPVSTPLVVEWDVDYKQP